MEPFASSNAARSSYWPGSNVVDPLDVGNVAVTSVGPLKSSAPVVTSRACNRW